MVARAAILGTCFDTNLTYYGIHSNCPIYTFSETRLLHTKKPLHSCLNFFCFLLILYSVILYVFVLP